MKWKIAVVLFLSTVATQGFTHNSEAEIRAYVQTYFPDVEKALANNTYESLRVFNHRLHYGYRFEPGFSESYFTNAMLVGAHSKGISVMPALTMTSSDLSFASFRDVDLRNVNLSNSKFFRAHLENSILDCRNIRGADFAWANLDGSLIEVNGQLIPVTSTILEVCGATDKKELTLIKHFVAKNRAWHCHWFPMQETIAGGDSRNLFGKNGPLHKLDLLNGGKARAYEYHHLTYPNAEYTSYCGHQTEAALVSVLLKEPKHEVIIASANSGELVHFSKPDIQGLLVSVVHNLIGATEFAGPSLKGALTPHDFFVAINSFSDSTEPFIYEGLSLHAWHAPINEVLVFTSQEVPANTTYFHVELVTPLAQHPKPIIVDGYFQIDPATREVISDKWFGDAPHTLMRPYPRRDISDKTIWTEKIDQKNPFVDPALVFEIYHRSLSNS